MQLHNKPLIIQADLTIWLETASPQFNSIRAELLQFVELIKTTEQLNHYRVTPLSLWNAAAAGMAADSIHQLLMKHAKFGVPAAAMLTIRKLMERYGQCRLEQADEGLKLLCSDPDVFEELRSHQALQRYWSGHTVNTLFIQTPYRGELKQEMTRLGYPVIDRIGFRQGEALAIRLSASTAEGASFRLRPYQEDAVAAFEDHSCASSGSGVLVLPCGAGKTIIGIAAMAKLGCATLILTTNLTSVRQWKREIIEKTNLSEQQVGEYSGDKKQVAPVTIATYNILTHRSPKQQIFRHMALFQERDWGLIIYDEVHLLPAPVFRATAEIQATRRLGLTATLIREDGREQDVFSLVGPKRFDMPWRVLEQQGWIAKVRCTEVRVELSDELQSTYPAMTASQQNTAAATNPVKLLVMKRLLNDHADSPTLIIGQYLEQLEQAALMIQAPMISGQTPHATREKLFDQFRNGELKQLVVSKVANFAVDLPDAAVAIQLSGSFGSRQEEAQRLGRLLRPKAAGAIACFYALVSHQTKEQQFALHRQLFLVEQGYNYHIENAAIDGSVVEVAAISQAEVLSG